MRSPVVVRAAPVKTKAPAVPAPVLTDEVWVWEPVPPEVKFKAVLAEVLPMVTVWARAAVPMEMVPLPEVEVPTSITTSPAVPEVVLPVTRVRAPELPEVPPPAPVVKVRPPPVAAPERVRTASPEIDENGVVALTDANYEETLKTGVWVVDVWADWCGPCMAMKPVFGAIARNHTDLLPPGSAVSINFAQLDRSETSKVKNPKMGRDNRFWTSNSLPRFVIFQDGKVIGSIVGYNTEPKFRNLLRGKLKGIAAPALQDGRVGQEFYPLPDN